MANVICHICLRTDIFAVKLAEELADFVDELCDYNIIENPRYKFCTICAHLLKKFYNFKQRCLKACKILKSHKGTREKRMKGLPTNLHEQIPSSIGFCSSLAPYKLLEHQHHTATDLLETKPDLSIELNITPNNAEANSKQNLEIADPSLPGSIKVKDEPMPEVLDSDIETMQVVDDGNIYIITTSNDNLTNFDRDFKEELEENPEELNTDTNKDGSKDNAQQSKINDFLKNFGEEIKELEDNNINVDEDNMEVKDTTFMLNEDPLRDDESLNSMDDIQSDISDCAVESLSMDEQNFESDSDLDGLSEIVEKAKNKKIKINEINDLELAELLFKLDKRNKLLKNRVQFLKDKEKVKDGILQLFEKDEYDLGDGLKISKEVFLKIYERCEKSSPSHINTFNLKDMSDKNKTDDFLRTLHKMYNPEYVTVFDIEYLDTEEKKLQEFNRRKDRAEYQNAPYQCTRCYRGFQFERLHAVHMKKHEEASGAYVCPVCFLRFDTGYRQRAHTTVCHSAVYSCRQCNVTFYYLASMLNHFNLHKGVEFPCPICNGIYRTATGLANHKRTHVTSHICTTCARSFVSKTGLMLHRRFKHKGAPEAGGAGGVRCAECPLTLDSQKAYKTHLRISHRPDRYVCSCLQTFVSMAELRQHKVDAGHRHSIRKESGTISSFFKRNVSGKSKRATEKAAQRTCPICQEEVNSATLYHHHRTRHQGLAYQAESPNSLIGRYLCEKCGKQFPAISYYVDHMNSHTGARPHQCPECPRAFANRSFLWTHRIRHRPPAYKCNDCGKLFRSASNLSCHVRIHKNDRRYICDVCSATFIHASTLTEHIKGVHQHQRRARKNRRKEEK